MPLCYDVAESCALDAMPPCQRRCAAAMPLSRLRYAAATMFTIRRAASPWPLRFRAIAAVCCAPRYDADDAPLRAADATPLRALMSYAR